MARIAVSAEAYAVIMITMVSGETALIFLSADKPSNLGMRMSRRTRSKRSFSTSFKTSSPLEARETLYPSFFSMMSKNSRMLCSSSATRILSFSILSPLVNLDGEEDHKGGPSTHLSFHFDHPVVVFNNLVNNGQSETRSALLRGEEGLEDLVFVLGMNTGPGIPDGDFQPLFPVPRRRWPGSQSPPGFPASLPTDLYRPFLIHGLGCIDQQIPEDLFNLISINHGLHVSERVGAA